MKKLIYVLFAIASSKLIAQSSDQNYIKTLEPLIEVKTQAGLNAIANENKRTTVTYIDGLGRETQVVLHTISPALKDVINFTIYDNKGRMTKEYLPFTDVISTMDYRSNPIFGQSNFYKSTAKIGKSNYPFSETVYDNLISNKVIEQSSAGKDWQLNSSHTVKTIHGFNSVNEVRLFISTSGNVTSTGYYGANELTRIETINTHGNSTITFTNRQGETVLKKVQLDNTTYAETYYVYNQLGQLTTVIPPKAYASMVNFDVNAEISDRVYKYVYDNHGRIIEKKLPNKGWEYTVYDKLDRPILTQDAVQKTHNQWLFTKYDIIGRVIQKGIYTANASRSGLQTISNANNKLYEERTATNYGTQHGYTNQSFPNANLDIHIINYYDDYDFDMNGSPDYSFAQPPSAYSITAPTTRTRSLATGMKVKMLDGNRNFLMTVSWYDEKANVIQTYGDNHVGGYDRIHTELNFVGQVIRSTQIHNDNANTITLNKRFVYDHAGRLKQTYHQTNQQNEILMSEMVYNELGQLVDKKLHATDVRNPSFLQSIDYSYNIKGWLTHINNADIESDVYIPNPYHPGQVLGFQISAIDFYITESESETEGRSLQLILEDQSQISVEGNIEASIYDYRDPVIITLMKYPEDESQISTYNDLKRLAGTQFQLNYEERPLSLTEETRLEEIQGTVESTISDQLTRHTENQTAIAAAQTSVVSYIGGLLKHTVKHDTPFSSQYLQFYFNEKGGQLFLNAYDANRGKSYEVFLMAKNAQNTNVYNFLFGLTNDASVFPPKSTPIIVDFGNANLYEGMGTKEAIKECLAYLTTITVGYNITHQRTLDQMELLAERFAIEAYPNTYFNNDSNDLWGMQIKYNSISKKLGSTILGNQTLYNGNISEITWQSKGDEQKRGYGYTYDGLNRLEKATFKAYNSAINSWNLETNRYDVPQITYDLNGNILSLQRNGFTSGNIGQNPTFGLMDNLSYTYSGDQLTKVSDAGNIHHINDFKDGNLNGNDYTYDANGNMIADYNKGIQTISYNHLNLPTLLDTGNGETITYIYDAAGNKLTKVFNNYGSITKTEYTAVGNYTKTGNNSRVLDFIFTDEGRLINDNGSYRYEYFYKDHLGNTRLVFSDQNNNQKIEVSEITQQQNYYPFGLEHKGTQYGVANQTTHKYLYNGKELQEELNIGWLDYGARNYDTSVGRWFNVDPLAEEMRRHSSYNYAFDNPIYFIDPDGMAPWKNNGDGTYTAQAGDSEWSLYTQHLKAQGYTWNQVKNLVRNNTTDNGYGYYYRNGEKIVAENEITRINEGSTVCVDCNKQLDSRENVNPSPKLPDYVPLPDVLKKEVSTDGLVLANVNALTEVGGQMLKNSRMRFYRLYGTKFSPKLYENAWGGNGSVKTYKTNGGSYFLKGVGYGMGGANAYNNHQSYLSGDINAIQYGAEQLSNGYSTLGGLPGAAWGIGWETGRVITQFEFYQNWKQDTWLPFRYEWLGY